MTVKEIKELVDLVARRGLAGLEIEKAGFRLKIEGPRPDSPVARRAAEPPVVAHVVTEPAPLAALPSASAAPTKPAVADGLHVLPSPIVGTFYRAANPDSEPFVKVGDVVEKGQTLCIIEAMKLMNEIEADIAGTIVTVHPQNGQPVEFGEKLFSIQPR